MLTCMKSVQKAIEVYCMYILDLFLVKIAEGKFLN